LKNRDFLIQFSGYRGTAAIVGGEGKGKKDFEVTRRFAKVRVSRRRCDAIVADG
jgi:hypothetical protein